MTSNPLTRTACSLVTLVALSSCSELLGPSPQLGTYALAKLNGQPAPFILSDDHFSAGNRIVVEQVADSIRVESDTSLVRGHATRTSFYAPDGTLHDSGTTTWSSTASYHVSGTRMTIVYPRRFLGDSVPPETLSVAAGNLIMGHRMVGGWCETGPPLECPTPPRLLEFTYQRR